MQRGREQNCLQLGEMTCGGGELRGSRASVGVAKLSVCVRAFDPRRSMNSFRIRITCSLSCDQIRLTTHRVIGCLLELHCIMELVSRSMDDCACDSHDEKF